MIEFLKEYAPIIQWFMWAGIPISATIAGYYNFRKTQSDHAEKLKVHEEQLKSKQSLEIAQLKEQQLKDDIKRIEDRQSKEVEGLKREIHDLAQRFSEQLAQTESRIIQQFHFLMEKVNK